MAITLKSRSQVESLRAAGQLVAETYKVLHERIVPGVSTLELDRLAEEFVRSRGAKPIYKGYGAIRGRGGQLERPAFPATICVAVNDVICHGIPQADEVLRNGDIIGIDIGVLLDGWVGDSCVTFAVGDVKPQARQLLDSAKHSMELGIAAAQDGANLGDIGAAIQGYAEGRGYSVVREWTGHGVGRSLHEEPTVLHHYDPRSNKVRLRPGMVFTVEPMINQGGYRTRLMDDGWTVRTADGSLSAQFEHTIVVTENGPEILTMNDE